MTDAHALAGAFYRAFNHNDGAAFDTLLVPHWINHPADPGQPATPAGFRNAVAETHTALEGFHIEVEAVVAEGDLVVSRIAMCGRQVGAFADRAPSGREVRFAGMDMHRIEAGRIVETWHFENFDGLDTPAG